MLLCWSVDKMNKHLARFDDFPLCELLYFSEAETSVNVAHFTPLTPGLISLLVDVLNVCAFRRFDLRLSRDSAPHYGAYDCVNDAPCVGVIADQCPSPCPCCVRPERPK